MKKPGNTYNPGDRVVVQGWQHTMPGKVIEKTSGQATRIRFDDGRTMLISNDIIRREEAMPIQTDRPAL